MPAFGVDVVRMGVASGLLRVEWRDESDVVITVDDVAGQPVRVVLDGAGISLKHVVPDGSGVLQRLQSGRFSPHAVLSVTLPAWCRSLIRAVSADVELAGPPHGRPEPVALTSMRGDVAVLPGPGGYDVRMHVGGRVGLDGCDVTRTRVHEYAGNGALKLTGRILTGNLDVYQWKP